MHKDLEIKERNVYEMYDDLVMMSQEFGYYILYDPDNPFTLHSVNLWKNHERFTKMSILAPANHSQISSLQDRVMNTGLVRESKEFENFVKKFFLLEGISTSLFSRVGSDRNRIATIYGENTSTHSFDPPENGNDRSIMLKSFVPQRSQLPEQIRHLEFEDFCCLFPPAETECYKTLIGKAVIGKTGSTDAITGQTVIHSFRNMGIIVGEPHIGKSYLLYLLTTAIKSLGFKVSISNNFGERFNQGEIVSSDLSVIDDLIFTDLKAILTSKNFKTIITGGQIKVQNKFQNTMQVESKTTMIINSNEWIPRIMYNLDSGVLDRIIPFQAVSRKEIEVATGKTNASVKDFIEMKAEKYNVTVSDIAYLMVRSCADHFLKQCPDVDTYIRERKTELTINSHINLVAITLQYMVVCYMIKNQHFELPSELNKIKFMKLLESFSFIGIDPEASDIRDILKQHWLDNGSENDHPWIAQRKLSMHSVVSAYSLATQIFNVENVFTIYEKVFEQLVLRNEGFSLTTKYSFICSNWLNAVVDPYKQETLTRLAEFVIDKLSKTKLKKIKESKNPNFENILDNENYDPKKL